MPGPGPSEGMIEVKATDSDLMMLKFYLTKVLDAILQLPKERFINVLNAQVDTDNKEMTVKYEIIDLHLELEDVRQVRGM